MVHEIKEKAQISLFKSKNTVFTVKDLAILWNISNYDYLKTKIRYYVKKGYLYRVHRAVYAKDKENIDDLELGNKLRAPSYISFETVLQKEGIIFQYYSEIFLVSYFSRSIKAGNKKFVYRKLKDDILFNEEGLIRNNRYTIATKERAFLDTLYLYKSYHFDNLKNIDWKKVFSLLKNYKSKSLEKRVRSYYVRQK